MIKISSIKFFNDPIFKNKRFDFRISKNKVASTIILAGENGCGKTHLLEFIYNILNTNNIALIGSPKSVDAIVSLEIVDEKVNKFYDKVKLFCEKTNDKNIINLYYNYYKGNKLVNNSILNEGKHELKALYSPAYLNYNLNSQIKNVSDKKLDTEDTSIPNDLASEITQLLVDITIQDNNDIAEYVNNHPKKIVPNNKKQIREKRFQNAFYQIFNKNIKYVGVENNTMPIFEKNKNKIKINDLSSGEKQIVFRGTFLLKNIISLKGVPVLIDEPELSMHPQWNQKIYNFYRRLFKSKNSKNKLEETSQMFIATHSEYVIESGLNDKNCLIIKMSEKLSPEKFSSELSNIDNHQITSAKIKYKIFNIVTVDYHIQLYSYIQNTYIGIDSTIKQVDDFLINQGSPKKTYTYTYVKRKSNGKREYHSLCTYIRNCIDHPSQLHNYTKEEFRRSINFMLKLINNKVN